MCSFVLFVAISHGKPGVFCVCVGVFVFVRCQLSMLKASFSIIISPGFSFLSFYFRILPPQTLACTVLFSPPPPAPSHSF